MSLRRADLELALNDMRDWGALGEGKVDLELSGRLVTQQASRKEIERCGGRFPLHGRIIAFLMCKGGVGKTTSAFFTARRLFSYGAKVLVVDADPQSNLTEAFDLEKHGISIDEETPVLLDVLEKRCVLEEAIIQVEPGLALLPSTPMNSNLDAKIRDTYKNPSIALRRFLEPLKRSYDFIIVDCAPALNLTNTAVVCAAETVLMPVTPDRFAKMGLGLSIKELQQIEEDFQILLKKQILLTRYDSREYTSQRYLEEIKTTFKDLKSGISIVPVVIRSSAEVKNAVARGEDLFQGGSRAGHDYDALAKYFLAETLMRARGQNLSLKGDQVWM